MFYLYAVNRAESPGEEMDISSYDLTLGKIMGDLEFFLTKFL